MKLLGWQTCKDLNKINDAIIDNSNKSYGNYNWEGLKSAEQIINVSWDEHLGCYIVFWSYEQGV